MIYAYLALILGAVSALAPLPFPVRVLIALALPVLLVLYVRAMRRRAIDREGR